MKFLLLPLLLLANDAGPTPMEKLEQMVRDFTEKTGCNPYGGLISPTSPARFIAYVCPGGAIRIVGFYPDEAGGWISVEALFPEAEAEEKI